LAIASVAAFPRPPVGPVISTVPDAIEFMVLRSSWYCDDSSPTSSGQAAVRFS
jgi:hypothetical protein